jgi:hypothetical protein
MSKLVEKIEHYMAVSKELGLDLSEELISKATEDLVPSIYKQDAETVSCSDSAELDTVKTNFLEKKLGVDADNAVFDAAIKKVCEAMGTSNRHKYRALFYALLAKEFGKESVYA